MEGKDPVGSPPLPRGSGVAMYYGFPICKETLTNSKRQLVAIGSLRPIEKQFIGTMVDTGAVIGYSPRRARPGAKEVWVAYAAAKMKYKGDLARLAQLVSHLTPSRSLDRNRTTKELELRWRVQVQGVVAYALLREVRPFLLNEKAAIEADCVQEHGPIVRSDIHPFEEWGAVKVRRGVWYWPQIDEGSNALRASIADK